MADCGVIDSKVTVIERPLPEDGGTVEVEVTTAKPGARVTGWLVSFDYDH